MTNKFWCSVFKWMAGDSWITLNRWNSIRYLLRFLGTFPSFYMKNWDNCPTNDQRNFQHVIFNSLNWDKEKIGTETAWEYPIEIKNLLIIFRSTLRFDKNSIKFFIYFTKTYSIFIRWIQKISIIYNQIFKNYGYWVSFKTDCSKNQLIRN